MGNTILVSLSIVLTIGLDLQTPVIFDIILTVCSYLLRFLQLPCRTIPNYPPFVSLGPINVWSGLLIYMARAQPLASFPALPRSLCSSVCVDNNTRM